MRTTTAAAILASVGLAASAGAQVTDWNSASGGGWNDAANWNPMNVPDFIRTLRTRGHGDMHCVHEDVNRIIRESGIHAFTMREIDEHGMAAVSKRALEVVNDGTAGFHVSFDVDGCDPTVIPGSGTLVPGGVSFREAHLLMEYVADDGRLQSMEIVELNPFLDERNISAKRTLELILSAMGKSIL